MKHTVLIVEDDPDIAECLQYNLELEELQTRIVESADDAILALAESLNPPTVVLLDPHALDVRKLQVVDQLREELERRKIPLILLTAFTSDVARIPCFQVMANYYIAQPYSMREISSTIGIAISRSGNIIDSPSTG